MVNRSTELELFFGMVGFATCATVAWFLVLGALLLFLSCRQPEVDRTKEQ